ncbi:MotA/TolQ/ExbB proton channel family protein [Klebsiella pneumoniae]|uniref:MotA/TolQ/ExbB proton channel family protein n=1 Tax=Klebsiella pneumoniae TaxID=573 RepID=UPI003A7FF40D
MQTIGQDIYIKGTKALDAVSKNHSTKLLIKVCNRLQMKMPISDIKDLLYREKNRFDLDTLLTQKIISLGLKLSPSVGMLGTILGMVQLLSSLNDPANIGGHMSLALLTTFYGLFFSIITWTPIQNRLELIIPWIFVGGQA